MTAVDRSPLISELMRDAQVTFVQGDVFAFNPLDTERGGGGQRVDWMVCDVIAEPPPHTHTHARYVM